MSLRNYCLLLFVCFFQFGLFAVKTSELKQYVDKHPSLTVEDLRKLKEKEIFKFGKNENPIHHVNSLYLDLVIKSKSQQPELDLLKAKYKLHQASKNVIDEIYIESSLALAEQLVHSSPVESKKIYFQLLRYLKEKKITNDLHEVYAKIANSFYQQDNYYPAIRFWKKAYKLIDTKDYVKRFSMLNNISLAYSQLQLRDIELKYSFKAESILKQSNKPEKEFLFNLLMVNRGECYLKLKRLKEAEQLFLNSYDYFKENVVNDVNYVFIVEYLTEIYEQTNRKDKVAKIIKDLETVLYNTPDVNYLHQYIHLFLHKYYSKNNRFKEAYNSLVIVTKNKSQYDKSTKEKDLLAKMLMTESIINDIEEKSKQNLKIQQQKNIATAAIVIGLLLSFLIWFYFRFNAMKKEQAIRIKDEELKSSAQALMESELALKQEKINSLQLNLHLKSATEKAFLEKIKEIKRKKAGNPEEMLKELQLQISTMLEIDKKNLNQNFDKTLDQKEFEKKIQEMFPTLNATEVRMCTYFRLNMSAKEISMIEGTISTDSVRVYKNRIKNKMGLESAIQLNEYLRGIN